MIKTFKYLLITLLPIFISAQTVSKIEPPNCWAGMKHNALQLLVYGENLNATKVLSENEQFYVNDFAPAFSGKYLFVNVTLAENIKPGEYSLLFITNADSQRVSFPVLKRENEPTAHVGFNKSDVIYLITPDRFANGDMTNDRNPENALDQYNRGDGLARHGGDIAGIIEHLDYIAELGVSAIWVNPLLENNMPISYHGYAATDLYSIDPRFGSNELYKKFVAKAHEKKLKVIYDHVSNHVGINHPWVKNPPTKTWFHGTPENHLSAMHEKMALFDVHADSNVIKRTLEGWFVNEMPDLNQRDEKLARYLIQNLIWRIEFAGIDGIREDTYAYVDQDFLARLITEVKNEYPNITFVGEVWTGEPEFLAPYLKENKFGNKNAELNIVTDFAFRDALASYLRDGNVYGIYNMFAKDFIYNPKNEQMIFLDNHDTERPVFIAHDDLRKVKSAYVLLFTARGIPQILYGDEIGMKGGKDHGAIRSDFPGGWEEDKRNAFLKEERTKKENEIYEFVKRLILLRKTYPVFPDGKMTHFPPRDKVYSYVRKTDDETFLILISGNEKETAFNLNAFENLRQKNKAIYDVLENKGLNADTITLPPFGSKILRIK
jgi:glycosidase